MSDIEDDAVRHHAKAWEWQKGLMEFYYLLEMRKAYIAHWSLIAHWTFPLIPLLKWAPRFSPIPSASHSPESPIDILQPNEQLSDSVSNSPSEGVLESAQVSQISIEFTNTSHEFLLAFANRLIGDRKFRDITAEELVQVLSGNRTALLSFYGGALSLCQVFSQASDLGLIASSKTDVCIWIAENVQFVNREGICTRRTYKYLYQKCKPSQRSKLPQPGRLGYIDMIELLTLFPPVVNGT